MTFELQRICRHQDGSERLQVSIECIVCVFIHQTDNSTENMTIDVEFPLEQ